MGCISVTPRCCKTTNEQEQEDLVQIPSTRRSSHPVTERAAASPPELHKLIDQSQSAVSNHLFEERLEELSGVELLWGKSRRDLEKIVWTEPIKGWEGEDISRLGEIVWSSSALLHDQYMEAETRRHLVLFPLHLLILAVDEEEQRFIYQGLLPLSGISVRMLLKNNTFEITGSMFDSRIIMCSNEEEFKIWMAHLPRRVKKASLYRAHKQHKLAMLAFEERIMVLFPDDLVILSTDEQKTAVKYEGRLPTHSIRALERSACVGHLEFEIRGEMMEPMKVSCTKPGEYKTWFFNLQKPDYSTNTLSFNRQPPPNLPKKRKSCRY
ncbi:probable pleckstrin homology domain-containing family N member 1 isoform X2 [Leucoraja erinacea]|uniref:probable pleckstrin homology domain-containing family N member 1 isoform X2 n=1 Tax=Leucoraja erinaceus TaxID=7782 RepID=UPI00245589A6|nr:probable pleckstrin homology domain-containing family N member 1 isoform X2 [Leucoraja erinacea]